MKVTPQLRYAETAQREPSAWLIVGSDPRAWLAEVTSVPLADARVYPLPGEAGSVLGVLVVPSSRPPFTGCAIPYSRLSERLLAPIDGRLDPPLAAAELAALIPPDEATYLWHPTAGLLRYPAGSAWRIANLLSAPALLPGAWDAAQPGTALNQRLLSIEPLVRPSLEDVMRAGRENIGTEPLKGSILPPAPGEPQGNSLGGTLAAAGMNAAAMGAGAIASAAGAIARALGALGAGLAGAVGSGQASGHTNPTRQRGKSGSSWIDRLKNWARQQQQAASQHLDRLRNKQVERLLNLLQQSPDDGLKYALPVAGEAAHRGLAPPSANLVERQVNFSLSGLGGGGRAADFWDLSPEIRHRLMQRYRELANREVTLGRHRRAAYIYAELLGDLTSAAATLADGGHFREAAVLYEERLKQPLRAAQCLHKGALWSEAITIYERLGAWETAGDLYLELDRPDDAHACYRRVVTRYLADFDYLSAAKLLETKLAAPDAAYETLLAGWPVSGQAQKCLDGAFALLARLARHDQAAKQLAAFRDAPPASAHAAPLAACLARVATTYPHGEIQHDAADLTRTLVSRRLPEAPLAESTGLLSTLASLVPADRLLTRDCHRYHELHPASRIGQASRLAALTPRRGGARLVSSFQLPAADWKTAVASFGDLYAAGINGSELVLVRARWNGVVQQPTGPAWSFYQAAPPILLADDPGGRGKVYVAAGPGVPANDRFFPATDTFVSAVAAGPHPGASGRTLNIQYGMGGYVLVLNWALGHAEVNVYSIHGSLATTLTIAFDPNVADLVTQPAPFFVRGQYVYLGVDHKLYSKHVGQQSATLHAPIRQITGPPSFARPRIAAACEQGGVVLWGESASSPESTFAMDLANPVIGFSRGGHLVAATAESIELFDTASGKLTFLGETPGPQSPPIAVLPTNNPGCFAVCTASGSVQIYEAPGQT